MKKYCLWTQAWERMETQKLLWIYCRRNWKIVKWQYSKCASMGAIIVSPEVPVRARRRRIVSRTMTLQRYFRCSIPVMGLCLYLPHQMSSMARVFIERLYPFFHVEKRNMSNTSKPGKKAGLILLLGRSGRYLWEVCCVVSGNLIPDGGRRIQIAYLRRGPGQGWGKRPRGIHGSWSV